MADVEKGGFRDRQHSVSNYEANMGANTYEGAHRRSSIVPANRAPSAAAATGGSVFTQKDDTLRKMSVAVPNLAEITSDAKLAAEHERTMTFREGVRLYPKAILFSFCLSLAVIMEGYDTWLLGNFFGMTAFSKKFGEPAGIVDGVQTYQVPAQWQSAIGNGTATAQIIGLFINGIISERIGYRKTMMGALVMITGALFVTFFAVNVQMLLAGYILSGLPWGVFQTLTTTYAAEVCPVALRPYLTTYVNLCWVIGQLIASGILKAFVSGTSEWAYRIPFAIQWIWPVPIFITAYFAPESPWWSVRHGNIEQARATLLKLTTTKNAGFNVEDTLAMMIHTNELEIQQTAGTAYWDCFKGVDRRRTELTMITWAIQTTSGSPLMGWGTYFMIQAGLSQENAFSLGVAQSSMGFIGTVASWFLMPHFGRRTLYIAGQAAMFIILMVIGGIGCAAATSGTSWATGALLLILTFTYDITVGPVCYSLVAELPSTRLRIKSVVLARNLYNVLGIVVGTLMPRMMNPTAWNWKAKSAFFWGGLNALGLIWSYFRLPEPKGLTYADLDILFENHVSARKFRKVEIDPYRSDNLVVVPEEGSDLSDHEHKGHM